MISASILIAGVLLFIGMERVRRALVRDTEALDRDVAAMQRVIAHLQGASHDPE